MKLVIALFSLFLVACGSGNNELGQESPFFGDDAVNQLDGVSIEMGEETYVAEGDSFELIISNDSDEEITYGAEFILEYNDEGTWKELLPDEEMAFILIAYILDSGEEASEEVDFSYYEPFDSGEYRLIREFQGEPLAAEFEIVE